MKYWNVEDMAIGDYISTGIMNKMGDRNLDGAVLRGTIVELVPSHNMVRLESGWCCHTKDKLLEHKKKGSLPKAEIVTQNDPRTD